MPLIYYQAKQYRNNYSHINSNGEKNIRCRKIDLYRSMITVGNPSYISKEQIREYGLSRAIYSSIIEKLFLIYVNIKSERKDLQLHPIFHTHVSDIKRNVSYNLGMAFAKFYAEKLFDIPSLIHVESLKAYGAIAFADTDKGRGREPDLVGQCSNGEWHVFEAKGMSTNQMDSKIIFAKTQAQRISSINAKVPETLNACATYFSEDRILTHLEDPKSKSEKNIRIPSNMFVESNYKPILMMSDVLDRKLELRHEDNLSYYAIELELELEVERVQLCVGIDEEIYNLIMQNDFSRISSLSRDRFRQQSTDIDDENYSIGLDGIIVKYRNH